MLTIGVGERGRLTAKSARPGGLRCFRTFGGAGVECGPATLLASKQGRAIMDNLSRAGHAPLVVGDRTGGQSRETRRELSAMIRCTPKGICSWNFSLQGEGHRASLEFNWTGEQGVITADGLRLEVCKHGVFSGHWTLDREGEAVASAQKSTPFTRTFEIESPIGSLVLRAESAFGRSFRVERSGDLLATISPAHLFTRRATIETRAEHVDFPTLAFSFWLAVLTWRRAASSGGGGGGG